MNANEARKIFNTAAANEPDPDKRASIELVREYACNPEFRAWLEAETFARTYKAPAQ